MFDMENYGFMMHQNLIPDVEFPAMKWKYSYCHDTTPTCPRCSSPNTKFCYYNNYSLSQPRYFCKACRRYWTKGGSLRNVPVGGGCRKKRRLRINSFGKRNVSVEEDGSARERSGGSSDADAVNEENVSEIDLAVVFAKFVNDNSASRAANTAEAADGASGEEGEPEVSLRLQKDDGNRVKFTEGEIENKASIFGLEYLFDDEVMRDVTSSDEDQTVTEGFSWEWPSQSLEDLIVSFPASNNESKLSEDLVKDDWTSMDLPGFGIFSNP